MYYREYKIYSEDLDTYIRWLKLCDLKHSDRSYELFVLDSFIEYARNKYSDLLKIDSTVLFNEKTKELQLISLESNNCIDPNIAWVRKLDNSISLGQIGDLKIKIDELENGKTRC